MKDRKSEDRKKQLFDQVYDLNSVASDTGMTGITPSLPLSDADLESYSKIQSIPPTQ